MGLAIFGESDFNKAQWVSENNNRGTWSLIQTCLITLGLCVYSAVHLNCFQSNCPLWMKYVVRGKWLIVALLAPEFIVFNAWSQRRQAVRLARILRRRSGQEEPKSRMRSLCDWVGIGSAANDEEKCQRSTLTEDSKPIENAVAAVNTKSHSLEIQEVSPEGDKVPRVELRKMRSMSAKSTTTLPSVPERFDLTQGFMIGMGGLVVDMSLDVERVWPSSCNTLTITPACFEECFEKEGFRDIDLSFMTRARIEARQKVDGLAKLLVIVQALWFCINFVARIAQALPVSLLELNTFAHALCALFIYMLWWHKPGDIEEPFVLYTQDSEALRDLCAAQWTSGAAGKHYEGRVVNVAASPDPKNTEWTPMFLHAGTEFVINIARGRRGVTLCPGSGEDWYLFDHVDRWFFFPHLEPSTRYDLCVIDPLGETTVIEAGNLIPETSLKLASHFTSAEFDTTCIKRWRRTFQRENLTRNYTVWLRDRQPNFAWPRGLDDSQDGPQIAEELLKSLFMFLITSLCYGGLHMLAWGSGTVGGTSTTQILWRISCLLLMGIGPFAYIVWLGLKLWRGADAHLRLDQSMSIVFGVVGVIAFVAYIMSRVYLLVEIILVIPYSDPGVYREPDFSAYWPHF